MNKKGDLGKRPPTNQRTHADNARVEDCQRPERCIFCGATRIWWLGYHERSASVLKDGEVVYVGSLISRRARCAVCWDSWIVRAMKVFPNRHFQLDVVAEAVAQYLFTAKTTLLFVATWAKCAERTLSRWIEWLGAIATPEALVARLTELAGQPVRLKSVSVASQDREGRRLPRLGLLTRAAWNLALLEALGQTLGVEPPGLKSILMLGVSDRSGLTTYASPLLPEFAWRRIWSVSASMAM